MSTITKKNSNTKKIKKITPNIFSSNIITTPCEKVLSILKQVKNFIISISKDQTKLIQNLDWCIKVITSRSLYSYELKEKETINKLSENNPEFKQLVDFVSEYNEKVIKMNRKYNHILSDRLLEKASTQLNKRRIERKNSFGEKDLHMGKYFDIDELIKNDSKNNKNDDNDDQDNFISRRKTFRNPFFSNNLKFITTEHSNENKNNKNESTSKNNTIDNGNNNKLSKVDDNICNSCKSNKTHNPLDENMTKTRINSKKIKKQLININDDKGLIRTSLRNNYHSIENISSPPNNGILHKGSLKHSSKLKSDQKTKSKFMVSFDQNYVNKKTKDIFPSVQKISITINNDNNDVKELKNSYNKAKSLPNNFNSINSLNISLTNKIVCSNNNDNNNIKTPKMISKSRKRVSIIREFSYRKVSNKLIHEGYDISKLITEKNFNIFELKEIIGYNNVLPIIGRVILENLGLLDEEIINISKLDKFLISVSNQYKPQSLYHNSLHGSDVTQSVYIFFTHSNAEKLAKTNVIDLLSVIIAALGHDIGHPGLTNTFHINDSTDIAITYNDISVLENFHAATLFKTIRKTENNIFDKLTTIDYKIIRKRMISEILATDMANHAKVVSLIKSKISLNESKEYKLNLISGNDQTLNEEQQTLLDFMLHLADLAHNTKLFDISKKWVELLSEEFWRQGDLEKELNLPVSFLCDRDEINIPQSQKGFISGYIIPTFESLVTIFPTLRYTLDNANNNLKEWQKLLDQGRKTGWTPPKNKVDEKRKINSALSKSIVQKKLIFKDFSSLDEKNNENENENENSEKKEDNKNEKILIENYDSTTNGSNTNDVLKIDEYSNTHTNTHTNKSRNNNYNTISSINHSSLFKNKHMSDVNHNHKNNKNISSDINSNTIINNNINNENNTINNSTDINKKKQKNKLGKFPLKKLHKTPKSIKIKINLRDKVKEKEKEKGKNENEDNTKKEDNKIDNKNQ